MVTVNYALIGANGDTIEFDYSTYVLNPEFTGFGIPPSEVRIEPSAGDGGVFRHAKRGIRSVDIPITVIGTDRADVQSKLRRLAKMTQHTYGPLILEARYSNGTRLRLTGYYTGGAESQWGSNAGLIWCRWVLSIQCPDPYWQSTTVQQFTIGQAATGRGLLPELSKLKLSSSQALGVVLIDNTGDVPVFPRYRITGPVEELVVSSDLGEFSFAEAVDSGEVITINTATASVTDQTGANRYSMLNAAPKFFQLPVGSSTLTISGTGATEATSIDVYYQLKFEVVH